MSKLSMIALASTLAACEGDILDVDAMAPELTAEECMGQVYDVSENTKLAVVGLRENKSTVYVDIADAWANPVDDLRIFVDYGGAMAEAENLSGGTYYFSLGGEDMELRATFDCEEWIPLADRVGATHYGDYSGAENLDDAEETFVLEG